MTHREKMEEVFAEIYKNFISETEQDYNRNYMVEMDEKLGETPFFSSLNDEQKKCTLI